MPADYSDDEYIDLLDDEDDEPQLDDDADPSDFEEEMDGADEAVVRTVRQPKWNSVRTRRLFRAMREGDEQAREQLVSAYGGLARYLARKFRNRGESDEDLEQVAYIGLLKALDRFEPERGHEFSTYATPTILGELRRHFRDKGWSVRVPRRLQELSQKVGKATDELAVTLGHMPSVAEVANELGVSVDEVLEAMESSSAYSAVSFDTAASSDADDAPALIDYLGDEDKGLLATDDRLVLEEAIATFSPREQQIVRMRFIEGLTQVEIAEKLEISQVQVSRLLRKTLQRLREKIEPTIAGE